MMPAASVTGLHWKKLDLHVHTPASRDYKGPSISPDEFVARAISKGLDGIAITDHNTAGWLDQIVAAAAGTKLAVFPGVEITVTGGKSGIHIIGLFDCNTSAKAIENLLAKLGVPSDDYGKLEAMSQFGPARVVDEIANQGGLAILAHADSAKGVLHDMEGQGRLQVITSPSLSAVEVTKVEKTARFLDGSDPNYKRRIPYYRASDNRTPISDDGHSIEGIASRFSWFKMDGITLEALKQCFADPRMRIRCDSQFANVPDRMYPRILALAVDRGFLKKAKLPFHEGLNSIIGGKGVGKSLIVELIRFALGQPSPIEAIYADMIGKLEQQLGIGGRVSLRIQLETDQSIEISRTYDGITNPFDAKYEGSGKPFSGDIAQLFPILAYSQTETLEIARQPRAQLDLIDTFLDLSTLETRIQTQRDGLSESDNRLASALLASEALAVKQRDMATLDEKIAQIDKALASKEFDRLQLLVPKTKFLDKVEEFANDISESCGNLPSDLNDLHFPPLSGSLGKDQQLVALVKDLKADLKEVVSLARDLAAAAEKLRKRSSKTAVEWARLVEQQTEVYRAWVKKEGGERPALLARRERLQKDRPALQKAIDTLTAEIAGMPEIKKERTALLTQLQGELSVRYEMRKVKYAELTAASGGRLSLGIAREQDRSGYQASLNALKKGSHIQDTTVRALCEKVPPREFVRYVLEDEAKKLSKAADIPLASAEKLIGHLRAKENLADVLCLEHEPLLEDVPSIRFKKDDGSFHQLSSISMGQKCTALLIIALSESNRPVVIDQPEDALDITSVYNDVTLQLRGRKHARQFILTTHNPTVAVASDTDEFHVLRASATEGEVSVQGAIDRPKVRHEIIQHLEGGVEPFRLKTKKYDLQVQ
jgi:hypothetical protein